MAFLSGAASSERTARADGVTENAIVTHAVQTQFCKSLLIPVPQRGLYPPIPEDQVKKQWIPVSGGHEIYVEESGNPKGKPVLYVHGGPGVGTDPGARRFFNPEKYRIISFSQRGSRPSRYEDPLRQNTTADLVSDMEIIRASLRINQWMLFGGSWGSTLSLAYAIAHPTRVTRMVLRGIYLGRKSDSTWYHHEEQDPATARPEWRWMRENAKPYRRAGESLDSVYLRMMTSQDKALRSLARRTWNAYSNLVYQPGNPSVDSLDSVEDADLQPMIEAHYCANGSFFPTENYILENIANIRDIPTTLIHGMDDQITSMASAISLAQAWPEAKLILVPGNGHPASEPGILPFLIEATDRYVGLK